MVRTSSPFSIRCTADPCRLFRARNNRHTAATHVLRSGLDLNTIRAWLSHASLDTTTVYAEIDLEAKA